MNLKAPSGIVWVVLCLVLALVVFTTLAVAGIVAQRAFAILCLVAMIIAGVASYRVFKNVCRPRKDPG
jgi:peptidoglycan/LPS O-acetylase OafA/YrhL